MLFGENTSVKEQEHVTIFPFGIQQDKKPLYEVEGIQTDPVEVYGYSITAPYNSEVVQTCNMCSMHEPLDILPDTSYNSGKMAIYTAFIFQFSSSGNEALQVTILIHGNQNIMRTHIYTHHRIPV